MIVFDEKEYCERLLKEGFIRPKNKIFRDIFVLCKYFKYNKLTRNDCKIEIYAFFRKNIDSFCLNTSTNDKKDLNKIINNVYFGKYSFKTNVTVNITQSEVDKIQLLEDRLLQKLAFTLLVLCKWIGNKNKFYASIGDIFDYAKITHDGKVNVSMMLRLEKLGYLYNMIKCEIYYIDNESEIVGSINDMKDLNSLFISLITECKGKYYCCTCGDKIVKKSNRKKYCENCWIKNRKEQIRINVSNFRFRQKCNHLEKSIDT